MTKLEEKLVELGYELEIDGIIACKKINFDADIVIGIDDNKINSYYVYSYGKHIRRQYTIDNLQQAFNEMQKDLEILKGVEDD